MIVLLIPTGLVLASQNSVPGDSAYPIKRQMEEVILSVLSLHPSTRAYFKVDFSKRRFSETTELFQRGKGKEAINSLSDLNSQTQQALTDVTNLADKYKKLEYLDNLLTEVTSRDQKLTELQQNTPTPVKSTPSPTPFPTSPVASRLVNPNATATPIPTPTSVPTTIFKVVPVSSPEEQAALKRARDENDRLKQQIETQKRQAELETATLRKQNQTTTLPPTHTPTPIQSGPTPSPRVVNDGAGGSAGEGAGGNNDVSQRQRAQTQNSPTPIPDAHLAGSEQPTLTPRPPTPTPLVECPDKCYSDQLWVGIHKAGDVCDNLHPDNVYTCDSAGSGIQKVCKNETYTCNGTFWAR